MEGATPRNDCLAGLAVSAVVGLFCVLLAAFWVPAFEGVDQNGYLCAARRVALTGSAAKHTAHPLEYVSENVVQTGDGLFYPKYPLGYPWLCAVAYRLGGPTATFWVNPILTMLALVGMFFLGCELVGATGPETEKLTLRRKDAKLQNLDGTGAVVERASRPFIGELTNGRAESDETRSSANARSTIVSGNRFAGVLGVILLATNPWHAYFGLTALSHTGAVCFAIWGMYFLWRWTQRGGWGNAALAGALTAYTCTIRYSEALLALPVVAMIVWRYFDLRAWTSGPSPLSPPPVGRGNRIPSPRGGEGQGEGKPPDACRQWRWEVVVMVACAVAAVLPLAVYQWHAFGAPWRTGYGLCGESTGFGWQYFRANWWLMLTKLNTTGLFLIFPLGLAGLAYVTATDGRRATLLGFWAVPSILLYTAYYWAPDREGAAYVRFFVSLFPALIIGALILLCEAVKPRPAWTVTLGVFIAVTATFNLRTGLTELRTLSDGLRPVKLMTDNVQRYVPAGSVLVATGDALNSLEYVGNYELYSFETFDRTRLTWRADSLKKAGPSPIQCRKAEALLNIVGKMSDTQLAAVQRALLASNIATGRMVAVVATIDQFRNARGRLGEGFSYRRLTEWVQETPIKRGDARTKFTPVAIYRLELGDTVKPKPGSLAALEAQIDLLQFRLTTLRESYDAKFPGARQEWDALTSRERQLRDLRDKARQLAMHPPAPR